MITLQQLRYFRELVKIGQLTKTADQLYISQATLSNMINNLEKQLGVKLFDRVGRNIQVNDIGRKYYTYINEALHSLDNAQSVIDEYTNITQNQVSVAMTSSNIWADLIREFHLHHNDCHIRQIDCAYTSFRGLLLDHEIDFVISGIDDFPLTGLQYQMIHEEPLYLCVSTNHPLAQKDSVAFEEIKNESYVSLPKTFGLRNFCDNMFFRTGAECRSTIECDYTLRGKMVSAGLGVAITTGTLKEQKLFGADVKYLPITDKSAKRPIGIIWNPDRYLCRSAIEFKIFVIDWFKGK